VLRSTLCLSKLPQRAERVARDVSRIADTSAASCIAMKRSWSARGGRTARRFRRVINQAAAAWRCMCDGDRVGQRVITLVWHDAKRDTSLTRDKRSTPQYTPWMFRSQSDNGSSSIAVRDVHEAAARAYHVVTPRQK
jgi:hypothetical protein